MSSSASEGSNTRRGAAGQPMQLRHAVVTANAPSPAYAYSQGVMAGGLLFVSGQVPVSAQTGEVPAAFGEQVKLALANVDAIARQAGTNLRSAVRVNVYLAKEELFEEMDSIYRGCFDEPYPSRTTVTVGLRGFAVEIDAVIALA